MSVPLELLAMQMNLYPSAMAYPPYFRDPWAKLEAWRKHPVFSKRAMFTNLFPGFGIAVIAFTGYVMFDNIYQESRRIKAAEPHH